MSAADVLNVQEMRRLIRDVVREELDRRDRRAAKLRQRIDEYVTERMKEEPTGWQKAADR